MNEKPVLYHATPNKIEGDQLAPNPNGQKTCVHYQFIETPQQSEHEGKLLFAGANQAAAYAYAFKIHDPDRMEGSKKGYCYMCSTGVFPLKDVTVPIAIIADRSAFFERLEKSTPTIYKMPAVNPFTEVHDKDGKPMGEWISREPVNIADCVAASSIPMEDAMEKGVQFLFLKEGMTKGEWFDLSQARVDELEKRIAPFKEDPVLFRQLRIQYYFEFLKEMIDTGVLQHYNRERGILPLDFETQTLPSAPPKLFVEKIPIPSSPDIAPATARI